MWKKILAVLCIPIALLLGVSTLHTTLTALASPERTGGKAEQAGYVTGLLLGFALMALLTFFFARWIVRTLWPRKEAPPEVHWPEEP